MVAKVTVVHKWSKVANQGKDGVVVLDTTSKHSLLSPFLIGPCNLYSGYVAQNMENSWQYSKVYKCHVDENDDPSPDYWEWATKGWATVEAHRYPMGRGAVPEYSYWDGEKLGYIDARKKIYGPLYAEAVQRTKDWSDLVDIYNSVEELYLRDWDGWDMQKHGMENLTQVLNNPRRKMGHAFVLKMLLEQDPALEEIELR